MNFRRIFATELRRRFNGRDVIIFFLIAVVAFLSIQHGKKKYLSSIDDIKVFQETENTRVEQYVLYRQYGAIGIRLLFISSPYSIIFNDDVFNHMLASVNTLERLDISMPLKGKGFFTSRYGMTFSVVILFLGAFIWLLYGYNTIHALELYKCKGSNVYPRKIFLMVVVSRLIISILALLLLSIIPLTSLLINNINLFGVPLVLTFLVVILMMVFFFTVGGVIATLKKSVKGVAFGVFYFVSVVIFPFLVDMNGELFSDMESIHRFDLVNLKTILEVDKNLINKFGSIPSNIDVPPAIKKSVKDAVKNEHERIRERESRKKNEMLIEIKRSQSRSVFFPVSFYLSLIKEVSSNGGLSIIEFYSFAQKRKSEFIDFYVDKRFFSKRKPDHVGPVENFVKTDENLFHAKSHIPAFFYYGILITCFYIAVSFVFFYRGFMKKIEGEPGELRALDIDIKPGKFNYMVTSDQGLKNQVFNFFSGRGKTFVNVSLDGKPLESKEFVYLFDTRKMPEDITPGILHKFLFGKKLIHDKPKWEILFDYAISQGKDGKIIIMDCFLSNRKPEEIKRLKGLIVMNGLKSLYISANWDQALNIADDEIIFHKEDKTVGIVEYWDYKE